MRAFFRLLSIARDIKALSRGPRAVVARQTRKALYRTIGKRVR